MLGISTLPAPVPVLVRHDTYEPALAPEFRGRVRLKTGATLEISPVQSKDEVCFLPLFLLSFVVHYLVLYWMMWGSNFFTFVIPFQLIFKHTRCHSHAIWAVATIV